MSSRVETQSTTGPSIDANITSTLRTCDLVTVLCCASCIPFTRSKRVTDTEWRTFLGGGEVLPVARHLVYDILIAMNAILQIAGGVGATPLSEKGRKTFRNSVVDHGITTLLSIP